jgi:hypothetical protein
VVEDRCSLDSEDLVEISKYYEKKQNYKELKEEILKSKDLLRKLPKDSSKMKRLFKKSLEKLN